MNFAAYAMPHRYMQAPPCLHGTAGLVIRCVVTPASLLPFQAPGVPPFQIDPGLQTTDHQMEHLK